jgi:hypothetical protein
LAAGDKVCSKARYWRLTPSPLSSPVLCSTACPSISPATGAGNV